MNDIGGLYLHIPYCRQKCIYCDFFSGRGNDADRQTLVGSLLGELAARRKELPATLQSIYIGGGTPSLLPPDEFGRLAAGIFTIAPNASEVKEFTIEVNPEDVNIPNMEAWKRGGVNRVSMGVQSLCDSELQFLHRNHDSSMAIRAIRMLRDNFENVSFDIMFGIPGQSMESLQSTLDDILAVKPDHLSAYSLMYEEGTALTAQLRRGDFRLPDEQLCVEMYRRIAEMASDAGLKQYEISNYARPGRESIHNSSYWNFAPYLGIGPSAHSYDGRRIRRANPWRLREYLSSQNHILFTEEILTDEEMMEEYVMLRLRTREGICIEDFRERFSDMDYRQIMPKIERAMAEGNLQHTKRGVALTREAMMQADAVILSLLT